VGAACLFPVVLVLGVLALVSSAVSPLDDDIQQVLVEKNPRCSRLVPGSSGPTHLQRNLRVKVAVLSASHAAPHRELAALVSAAESSAAHIAVFVTTSGERSPPIY